MDLARIGGILLLLMAGPAAAAAQPAAAKPPRGCSDDRLVDRCAPEQQAGTRALFGARPIEEHLAAGDQVRRVFYVDGYGRDLVLITFIRPRGGDPRLEVRFPRSEGGAGRRALEAPVPKAVWDEVIDRSGLFDRPLARPAAGDDVSICLHSWVYTVEAADPPRATSPQRLRRRTGDACHEDLVQAYAGDVARAAVPLLAGCDLLDRRRHRNEATLLAACGMLEGDRLVAAQALNRAQLLAAVNSPADAGRAQGVFDYRGTVEWDGERLGGEADGAMAAWLERTTRPNYAYLAIHRVVGEAADQARVEATLTRRDGEGARERVMSAPVTLHMSRGPGDDFTVARAVVGPFKELPLR